MRAAWLGFGYFLSELTIKQETSQPGTAGATLVDVLRQRAARQPEDLAYTFLLDGEEAEARLTYGELDRRARGLAATLAREGVGGGDRVLLLYPPGLDYIAAFFGCLYAGAVAVPAYPPRPRRPSARLTTIQESAGAKAVLTTAAILAGLDRQLPRRPGVLWQAAEGAELEQGAEEWRDPGVGGEALAFLQYTSGSTAAPKGVMLRHANLLANLEQIRLSFVQTPAERTVIWLPPYHDMGLIGGILTPLYAGNPAVLLSPVAFLQRPLRWLQAISRYRGTTSGGPNFAYDLCVEKIGAEEREKLDLSSWTLAFNGAEPVRAATLERFAAAFAPCGFRAAAFLPCYGLAEGTLLAAVGRRGAGAAVGTFAAGELERHRAVAVAADAPGTSSLTEARTLVGCGTAPVGARLSIVDPESGAPRGAGEVGEIWIAGPAVAAGYWGLPEATAATFGARAADGDGPFLRTGDLGFLGDSGELFVTGRSKDLIILRGRNHYPQDIELTVERAHAALRPGCGAAFAVAPREGDGDERLVVVQEVRREQRDEDPAEVVAAIRRAVADEHEVQVDAVVLLRPATIPKTTSGKIQRALCRSRYLEGTLEELASWRATAEAGGGAAAEAAGTPGTPGDADLTTATGIGRWLAAQIASRAGMKAAEIELDCPLSHYPLDSLAAIELMHAVESRLGAVLSMDSFFGGESLSQLAEEILARAAAATLPEAGGEVGDHPLSRGQQSLWFLHALDPQGAAYNVPSAARIRGPLDLPALLGALAALAARHAALRTTFPASHGEPVQRVHPPETPLSVEEVDARGWSAERLAGYLAAEAERPFDLEDGPLARVVLLACAPEEHVLLLAQHHAVTDFWSLGLLLDDLGHLYPALRIGETPKLAPAGRPFSDHVRSQEAMLAGPEGERLWEYWRSRLGGELPVLDLHTDRPRPRVQAHAGGAHRFRLSAALSARLKEVGRRLEATPFVTLLAAFEVLLHRYSRQDDLLIGTVTAARTRAGFARTAGYFVNPLVLRARFAGDGVEGGALAFAAHLGRARADTLGAFEHQELPFALLVERLQPERDPGRSPLFQAMFVLQKALLADGQDLTACALGEPGASVAVGGLRLEIVPLEQRIAQFDVTLTLGEVGEELVASFDYAAQLFDAVTVERWSRHFERLLEGIAADPVAPVDELPLLTAPEESQLLTLWNDTAVDYRRDATLPELLAEQAARTPDAVAVIAGTASLTYGELDRRARRLAARLRACGVGPETRVAVCLERSPELMVGLLGVLKAGGAYLPVDPETPRARVMGVLAGAGVEVVVSQAALWSRVAGAEGPVALVDLVDLAQQGEPDEPHAHRSPAAENLACVLYTSGSTGTPKGVLLTHRNLVNLVASFLASYRPEPEDRILPLTALGFASFVGEIYPLLCAGGTLVLPGREELLDVSALVALIARHGVSIVSTVPSMMASLNALRSRLPRLRLLLVGGEALSAGDVDQLLGGVRIVNGYGLTETSVCTTCRTLTADDLALGALPPIGRPLHNHRVYLLDRHLQPLPSGCAGEIYIAGDGLARGYLGDPAATALRFLPDPWDAGERMYRTGDLGLLRGDGELLCLGRVDQQVKVRGFRIELAEIESALALHPGVQESCVTVRAAGGEAELVAYLVPAPGATPPSAGELLAYLRERLPDYMVPAALVNLPALPLTPNGKVDLSQLPAPDRARPTLASAYSAPRSELERTIAALWQEELKVETVGVDDNFFDLGGHSLRMAKVHARLKEALGREVSLIELFQYPTVSSLARHLSTAARGEAEAAGEAAPFVSRRARAGGDPEIAIVGMAGRFPGAKGVEELWANLTAGREGIRFFSAEELLAAGIDPALVDNPNYVRAKGILGEVDLFDAGFFGLNPREVELMDPQHRLFLECSWEALENAGWDAERYPGLVGVYAGESMNTYMIMNLLSHMELVASVDTLQASLGNDKDPLTSRVSYKLNLKGPSITIQSASSTSLVAVHQACQGLLQHDCDMALAGGVSIHLPEVSGYLYQEGGTTARDGHTRAFDADSTGFVSGHGAGVVVLKRLADAQADGDRIYAVIKGSACNNDGSAKVSFMAPSVEGQVEVYRRAYENAGVDPRTVSYIECHGTGTAMGDPIEIAALSRVFSAGAAGGESGDRRHGYCAIGSLKTNIGHLDTAAGVCGLIKAALALHHEAIPASLHFSAPNPRIDFAHSPFFVNTALAPWPRGGSGEIPGPRRAGVTSLGMGGTNAHVVLEEAPPAAREAATAASRPHQLLLLSAKSASALERATARLADHLHRHADLELPDVAFTLTMGRKAFPHRRALLCSELEDAATALSTLDPERLLTASPEPGDRPVAFLFPGQGAQYVDMGRGLYDAEPTFRADVDLCCRLLEPHLGFDLRAALFADGDPAAAGERLQRTQVAQPALFVVSWATARLWMSWGVRPEAMLGHSIGEYVAACLAGVFSLEDALAVVAVRGRLMGQMPPGAMLGVPLPEAEVLPLLGDELSLAAVNRPAVSVVAGPIEAVDELAGRLAEQGLLCRRLHTSHAFHSRMLEPVLRPFIQEVERVRLEPPRLPFLSNVTGTWIRPEEATDPVYWAHQLRQTVRFADAVALLLAEPRRILVEAGPGNTLSTLARQHPAAGPGHAMIATLRHPKQPDSDPAFLLQAVARFWLAGGEVDWSGFWAGERRRRVALPTYPFERRRYWVDPLPATAARKPAGRRNDPADWLYVPVWKQSRLPAPAAGVLLATQSEAPPEAAPETVEVQAQVSALVAETWLVFLDRCGLGEELVARLEASGRSVVRVVEGAEFAHGPCGFTVAPGRRADYDALLDALGRTPTHVLHLWNVTEEATAAMGTMAVDAALDRSYYSLVFLAQALGRQSVTDPTAIAVVSNGLCDVTGEEPLEPLKAALLGPVTVVPREVPSLSCRTIDVTLGVAVGRGRLAAQILAEVARTPDLPDLPAVAFRGSLRWVREVEAAPLPALAAGSPSRLRRGGVCLITGGLGGIGLELAESLARDAAARLVLVGRSPFPERERWAEWLAAHDEGDPIRGKIERLLAIEEQGGEVLVLPADVTDPAALRAVRAAAERRFGAVHGVIHAAGVPGGGLLQAKTRATAEPILAPKVRGALALAATFAGTELDLFVLTSSITALLPEVGQADYVAANAFLDAFAAQRARSGEAVVSINWDAWREVGMAIATEVPEEWRARRQESLAQGLASREGVEAFRRIAASGLPQVVVSTLDFATRRAENGRLVPLAAVLGEPAPAAAAHPRPALATAFVPPQSDLERDVARVWQEILGVDPVGVHDNFFELGGNSLAGLRLVQRLRELLGAGLSEVSLYEAPTVGALARMIAAQGGEPDEAAVGTTPVERESRQRGERRKARILGRRGVGG
jgi:amino acid adenylation domain-containing protein